MSDRQYVYLVEPSRDPALTGWQAALAGRESKRANVVLIGPATVEGYPTTDFSRTPAQELAKALRAKYNTSGLGIKGGRGRVGIPSQGITPALPTPLTFTGGFFDPPVYNQTPTLHYGASHTCWYTNTANHKIVFTMNADETSFDLVHVVGPTGHAQAGYYKVNGGQAIPFSTAAGTTALSTLHVGAGAILIVTTVDGGSPTDVPILDDVDGGPASSVSTDTVDGGTATVGGTGTPLDGGTSTQLVGTGGYDGGTPSSIQAGALDGGTPTVTGGGSPGPSEVPPGAVIEIGCSGTGYLIVSEILLNGGDENRGIQVHGVGHAGYKASDFATAPTRPAGWHESIANLKPDVIVIEAGLNDATANLPAAFRTSLLSLVTAIRSVGGPIPTVPILIAAPYDSSSAQLYVDPWPDYVAEMRYVANTDDLIAFLNEGERMPPTDALMSFGLYHTDEIHSNANGKAYAMQAQLLAEALSFG